MRRACWSQNDELFFAQARLGHKWEEYVAAQLVAAGLIAKTSPLSLRSDIRQAGEYASQVDVWVGDTRIEVKSRDVRFTCVGDFPYETIFVTTVKSWQECERKPSAFVVVSQITGAMIALSSSTWREWDVEIKGDRKRNIARERFLVAHRTLWRPFESLVTVLRAKYPGISNTSQI